MTNKQTPWKTHTNKEPHKSSLSHINIKSIRNKLHSLFEFTYGLADSQWNKTRYICPNSKAVTGSVL